MKTGCSSLQMETYVDMTIPQGPLANQNGLFDDPRNVTKDTPEIPFAPLYCRALSSTHQSLIDLPSVNSVLYFVCSAERKSVKKFCRIVAKIMDHSRIFLALLVFSVAEVDGCFSNSNPMYSKYSINRQPVIIVKGIARQSLSSAANLHGTFETSRSHAANEVALTKSNRIYCQKHKRLDFSKRYHDIILIYSRRLVAFRGMIFK